MTSPDSPDFRTSLSVYASAIRRLWAIKQALYLKRRGDREIPSFAGIMAGTVLGALLWTILIFAVAALF